MNKIFRAVFYLTSESKQNFLILKKKIEMQAEILRIIFYFV